jgi:aspartate/glutamate racemase
VISRQIKTIGIVGGLGPGSTIEYYRQIIARYRERISDGSYPPIIIHSMDVPLILQDGMVKNILTYLLFATAAL